MYKAILWDVDGTLLNFLKSENAAIKECFQHFGLPECTDEMVGVYSAINEGYWKLLERGEITKPELFTRRFRDFFGKIGVTCDEAEFNALYQRTLGSHIFPNDNGIELVRSLKGRVHQYAVTNGSAVAQERKLSVSGLDKLFDGIFISDKVGAEKPATEFFDRVFEQIPENRCDNRRVLPDKRHQRRKQCRNSLLLVLAGTLGASRRSSYRLHDNRPQPDNRDNIKISPEANFRGIFYIIGANSRSMARPMRLKILI